LFNPALLGVSTKKSAIWAIYAPSRMLGPNGLDKVGDVEAYCKFSEEDEKVASDEQQFQQADRALCTLAHYRARKNRRKIYL
jgi:hypothetical protein